MNDCSRADAAVDLWVHQPEENVETALAASIRPAEAQNVTVSVTISISAEPDAFEVIKIGFLLPYFTFLFWTLAASQRNLRLLLEAVTVELKIGSNSEYAGFQTSGHRHSQLRALGDEFLPPHAATDQRLLNFAPAQSGHDRLDTAFGAGAVISGSDVKRIGQALGPLQAGVIAAIEEVLQRSAHVAKVFCRAENNRVRGQNLRRRRRERAQRQDFDPFDFRRARSSPPPRLATARYWAMAHGR